MRRFHFPETLWCELKIVVRDHVMIVTQEEKVLALSTLFVRKCLIETFAAAFCRRYMADFSHIGAVREYDRVRTTGEPALVPGEQVESPNRLGGWGQTGQTSYNLVVHAGSIAQETLDSGLAAFPVHWLTSQYRPTSNL